MNFGSNVNYIYYDKESDNGSNGVVMGWGATLVLYIIDLIFIPT